MNPVVFRYALLAIYAFSGLSALAYEVLWTRMLSLIFGVSIFGVVITAAAFMAGLGLGSLVLARLHCGARSALRWLAVIEGGIALFALGLPLLMQGLDSWLIPGGGGLSGWYGTQGAAAFLLLCIPAFGMGAGFPLVLKAAVGRCSLGAVYGVNTLGGALGALLPLWLLPLLGWTTSVRVVACVSVLVSLCAWWLAARSRAEEPGAHGQTGERPELSGLLAYGGIGAAALMLEVAWTRLYGMLMLRTEYVMGVILAVFLVGIALGSLVARRRDFSRFMHWLPLLAAMLSLASLHELPLLAAWAESMHAASLAGAMLKQGGAIMVCTLPVTLILGAWLPLLSRRMSAGGAEDASPEGAHASGAWLYGANSFGAALGALLAGFVLLPVLGTAGTLCLAAAALFVCGMLWVTDKRWWLALPLLALLIWPVRQLPQASVLLPRELHGGRDLLRFEDAVSITHAVRLPNGQRLLLSDLHRMDASTDPTAVAVQKNQARLPLLLHPAPHSMLFLGLGTGITASASLADALLSRTAVELSAGAIAAAGSAFAPVNGDVTKHMRVVRDDARRFLRADAGRYDIILGDLFHPDMVGRSALLSVQQFARGRRHLNAGGMYVQWLALNQFDVRSLQTVLASFRKVFPGGVLFVDGFRLAMVGVRDGRVSAAAVVKRFNALDAAQRDEISGGEGAMTWLGRFWGPIPALDAPLQDEWSPVIEFSLPRARFGGGLRLGESLRWLLQHRTGPDAAIRALGVPDEEKNRFRRAWAATSLNMQLELAALSGRSRQAEKLARMAYRANPKDRWAGFALADRMFATVAQAAAFGYSEDKALAAVLKVRPDHIGALKASLHRAARRGDGARAQRLRRRVLELSPLDAEVSGMTPLDSSGIFRK